MVPTIKSLPGSGVDSQGGEGIKESLRVTRQLVKPAFVSQLAIPHHSRAGASPGTPSSPSFQKLPYSCQRALHRHSAQPSKKTCFWSVKQPLLRTLTKPSGSNRVCQYCLSVYPSKPLLWD